MRNRLQRRGADPGRVIIPRCLAESAESVKTPAPLSVALLPVNGERQAGRQADWAAEISRIAARRTAKVLELAGVVYRARENLRGHGQWTAFWRAGDCLPFGKRKADQLVLIGSAFRAANVHECAQLPPSTRALYHLARIGWDRLQQLLAAGKIHPRMKLSEVRRLLTAANSNPAPDGPVSRIKQRLGRFIVFVSTNTERLSGEELEMVRGELEAAAKHLGKNSGWPGSSGLEPARLGNRKLP